MATQSGDKEGLMETGTGVSGGNALDQFVLLAKTARGAAAQGLVEQAVSAPGVYVFAELLVAANIGQLAASAETKPHWDLINLFAYGTYDDFVEQRATLPPFNDAMHLKLRQLTIVSLASSSRRIPYQTLLDRLRLSNVRELEDIVIDGVYKGVIQGKLDPRNSCLEIESWRGRDVPLTHTPLMLQTLGDWASRCQVMLCDLETQIERANKNKADAVKEQQQIETEVSNLKKTIKMTGRSATPDLDEPSEVSSSRVSQEDKKKRMKGLRGSSGRARFFATNT